MFIDFRERGREREKNPCHREISIHTRMGELKLQPIYVPRPWVKPTTWICVLIGDLTCHLYAVQDDAPTSSGIHTGPITF